MTKNDIAHALCLRVGLQKAAALDIVEAVTDIVSGSFVKGENLYLRGFGTFEVRTTAAKKARNISAGTEVIVPAGRTVKFKISSQLKNRMNNGK